MTLPWWPIVWIDIIGSTAVLGLAAWILTLAWQWTKAKREDAFRHYIFMLTTAICFFAVFRSCGHLVKQWLIYSDLRPTWEALAPFSGAGNTAAFIAIFAFSIYFDNLLQVRMQVKRAEVDLAAANATAEAARQGEIRLRTIFDGMADVVYIIDEDYRIIFFNRQMEALLPGIEIGALCYKTLMGREQRCKTCAAPTILAGSSPVCGEITLSAIGRTMNILEIPIIWINGKKVKLNVARDVTDHKRLEEQLRHAQKMEAIGTLAGGVAHDLNNTLTPIMGYADLALLRLDPDAPLKPYLTEIRHCCQRASELIRQILAFSRRQVIKPEQLNTSELIGRLANMLRRLLEENIALEIRPAEQPWTVFADPGQLEQVVINLAVNARDAMADGGLLVIKTANVAAPSTTCMSCGAAITGPHLVITVEDNGTGMAEDVRSRIFEPYFTTKGLHKGTGLGLAMVHGIVHQHRGHIDLNSQVDRGTTFEIYLPAENSPPMVEKSDPDETISMSGGNETILVVEDDDQVRQLTMTILKEAGYRVLSASAGKEALTILAEHQAAVDLLLTDVIMADMDGKKLATEMRRQRPDLRVIYMSGYIDNLIARHGILEPEVLFIGKPFGPAALLEKVREAIRGKG
ncbi:MAG: response regulator [Desulfobacteraceae bacterium]|nr:MAG: response regulator [Desulfobacteraceae bacterium]